MATFLSSLPAAPFRDQPEILGEAMTVDFEAFYRREFPQMVGLARVVCGDFEQAEDLAQEAMSRAHNKWHKVSHYDKPGAWLRRVTINLALSRRRGKKRELRLLELVGVERGRGSKSGSFVHDDFVSNDFANDVAAADSEVWLAVSKLPPRQRAAVALFYQEDLSTTDIAEILGCSVSTATSHLSAARTRLATLLQESNHD